MNELTKLSDDALVESLEGICAKENGLLARLILHLMEVEERRLHLKTAYSSLFDFCTRRLGMGEGAAWRRISVARLARRFPRLLASIERGDVSLETLVLVRNLLTEANVDELLAAITRKSTRQVQEIVACRAPQPDAPSRIRKLPGDTAPRGGPASPGSIQPIADARYKLQLTASAELCAKVERARTLLRHRNPSGDLSIVIERALDALIEKLDNERLGKAPRPGGAGTTGGAEGAESAGNAAQTARPPRTAQASRASCAAARPGISRALRREVFERDGEQCTFVSGDGTRCPSQAFLELDHVQPHALGGATTAANLRVLCRAHNALHAEERFGRTVVERGMDLRRQRSAQQNATKVGAPASADCGLTSNPRRRRVTASRPRSP